MWGRASAGAVPGFFLAAAVTGLACWGWPGPWQSTLVLGMVVFFILWIAAASAAFAFANGVRAWVWYGSGAIAALALLGWLQRAGWVV